MAGLFDYLKNAYQSNVDMPKRMYGESLVKSLTGTNSTPQTESNFTKPELDVLKSFLDNVYQKKVEYFSRPKEVLLQEAAQLEKQAEKFKNVKDSGVSVEGLLNQAKNLKNAAQGKLPTDFSVGYRDVMNLYPQNTKVNWNDTLGQFRFKVDEKGNYQVYDNYDFDNPSRSASVKKYADMNPLSRFASSVSSFLQGNESALGEAYLGTKSVPVNINLQYRDPFGDTTK
jgi:hypothetical protein